MNLKTKLSQKIVILALMTLVACGGSEKPKAARPNAAGANKPPAKDGGEEAKKAEDEVAEEEPVDNRYMFTAIGKSDPFQPFLGTGAKKDNDRITTPLENFDIMQLKLKGVVWGMPNTVAMIEDPKGKGYVVKVGTPIGKNDGKIVEIQQDKVVILEQYTDPVRGKVIRNKVFLELPKDEGDF